MAVFSLAMVACGFAAGAALCAVLAHLHLPLMP
jgi:hypothetical protein